MKRISSLLINKIYSKEKQNATSILLYFVLLISNASAQINYVQNPSFEQLDSCLNNINYQYPPKYWDTLRSGGGGGPEICSICSNISGLSVPTTGFLSYQQPRSGNNYCFYTNYTSIVINPSYPYEREYIQNQLTKTLATGKKYCAKFYVSLMNESKYAITELGGYLDDGTISTTYYGVCNVVPQIKSPNNSLLTDTSGWTEIKGVFTANGSEKFLTIGNFKATSATVFSVMPSLPPPFNLQRDVADYYIDDVSVIEYDLPAYAGRDTVICTGDSVFIGRPPEIGLECLWFSGGSQIAAGGGLWVKPATTQTFMVQQDVCGLIKTSTVNVQVKPKYAGGAQLVSNLTEACLNDSIKLNTVNPPPGIKIKYDWLPHSVYSATTNLSANAFVKQNTTFTSVITSKGEDGFCPFTYSDSVNVIVPDSCFREPLIPNIFTPNNDGVNDVWKIKFPYGFKLQSIIVYDRWGTKIFEREELSFNSQAYSGIGWDGRTTSGLECSDGVYFYVLKYTNKNNESMSLKGNITLIK